MPPFRETNCPHRPTRRAGAGSAPDARSPKPSARRSCRRCRASPVVTRRRATSRCSRRPPRADRSTHPPNPGRKPVTSAPSSRYGTCSTSPQKDAEPIGTSNSTTARASLPSRPPASVFGANLPLWKAHGHAAVMSGLVDVTHHASLVNVVWVRARCDLHQDAPNRVTVGDLAGQTRDHLVGRSHLCSGAVEHCVDRTSSEPVWPRGSASQAARPSGSSSNSASGCVGAFSRPAAASEGHDDAHVDCGNGPLMDRRHRTAAATVVAEEGGNQPLVE
jgi:hypothetical protein